jgi:hypothetical protein
MPTHRRVSEISQTSGLEKPRAKSPKLMPSNGTKAGMSKSTKASIAAAFGDTRNDETRDDPAERAALASAAAAAAANAKHELACEARKQRFFRERAEYEQKQNENGGQEVRPTTRIAWAGGKIVLPNKIENMKRFRDRLDELSIGSREQIDKINEAIAMNEAREASKKETRERALQQGARAVSEAMVPTTRVEARKDASGDAAAEAMEDDEMSRDEGGVEAGSTRWAEIRAEPSTARGEESETSMTSGSEMSEDEGASGGDVSGSEANRRSKAASTRTDGKRWTTPKRERGPKRRGTTGLGRRGRQERQAAQ